MNKELNNLLSKLENTHLTKIEEDRLQVLLKEYHANNNIVIERS